MENTWVEEEAGVGRIARRGRRNVEGGTRLASCANIENKIKRSFNIIIIIIMANFYIITSIIIPTWPPPPSPRWEQPRRCSDAPSHATRQTLKDSYELFLSNRCQGEGKGYNFIFHDPNLLFSAFFLKPRDFWTYPASTFDPGESLSGTFNDFIQGDFQTAPPPRLFIPKLKIEQRANQRLF